LVKAREEIIMSVTPSSFPDVSVPMPPDMSSQALRQRIEELVRENERLQRENESLRWEVRCYRKSLHAVTRATDESGISERELAEAEANPISFEQVRQVLESEAGMSFPRS
jgi:hypothetical protein